MAHSDIEQNKGESYEAVKAEIAMAPEQSSYGVCLCTVGSRTFKHFESWIAQSCEQVRVTKVQRIYDPLVHAAFQKKKAEVAAKRGMTEQEVSDLLWHAAPWDQVSKICGLGFSSSTTSGFSPKPPGKSKAPGSSDEKGIYFQQHAQFALTVGGRGPNGDYTLVVGEVITGKKNDVGLLAEKIEHEDFDPEQFDSVTGLEPMPERYGLEPFAEYGRQHIIFDRTQACPHFVVTFRRGFTIQCLANGLFLYTDKDKNGEAFIGGRGNMTPECEWEINAEGDQVFSISSCNPPHSGLIASAHHNWTFGVGAGKKNEEDDCLWTLEYKKKRKEDGEAYYRVISVKSARALYIRDPPKPVVGAGWPTTRVDCDGNFRITPEIPKAWMESKVKVPSRVITESPVPTHPLLRSAV